MEFSACRIRTSGEDKKPFVYTDYFEFLNSSVAIGDTILIPLNVKDDNVSIWESGGRKKESSFSMATVIAGQDDNLLNAVLFNKLNRAPNIKQAMIVIKPGYHVYVGKMSIKHNILAPRIKIIRLVFNGICESPDEEINNLTTVGRFEIEDIYTDYQSFNGNIAAERLLCKLYAYDVIRPFYANGWNISKRPNVKDQDKLINVFNELITPDKIIKENDANKFIDAVENQLAQMHNKKLSSALQLVDFENSIMTIAPLKNLDMKDVVGTIGESQSDVAFSIDLDRMLNCYNPNIIFESTELGMLEATFYNDTQYAINVGPRKYMFLRAWRG